MTEYVFLSGLLIGGFIGVVVMALMFMARDSQKGMDE